VDEQTDSSNCGKCGLTCPPGLTCRVGTCCPAGLALCDDSCVETTKDQHNCGQCGTDCGTGKCENGMCVCPTTSSDCPGTFTDAGCLVTLAGGPTHGLAITSTSVFWTALINPGGQSAVMKGSLCGGDSTTLAQGQGGASDVAVYGPYVYWIDAETSTGLTLLKRTLASGGLSSTVACMLAPGDIAVGASDIYWTEDQAYESGYVVAVPKQQTISACPPVQTPFASGGEPLGIALDAASVYWASAATNLAGTNGSVVRASLDGGPPVTLASDQNSPFDIAVDSVNAYWTNYSNTGSVVKVRRDGGASSTLASGTVPLWIATDGTSVYWTTYDATGSAGTVMKVSVDGGESVTLASGLAGPAVVAVDSTSVYWSGTSGLMKLTPK
jgi:hypothetical protein